MLQIFKKKLAILYGVSRNKIMEHTAKKSVVLSPPKTQYDIDHPTIYAEQNLS